VSFWTNYVLALAVVAIVVTALALAARFVKGAAWRARSDGRFVNVVESAILSPHASIHVLQAGRRHLLIGVTDARVCALAEIDVQPDESR
jgi:flagellar biogenesis protein FliO